MNFKRISAELKRLQKVANPSDTEKKYVLSYLDSSNYGFSKLAVGVLARWGGAENFARLRSWTDNLAKKSKTNYFSGSEEPFREFDGSTYILTKNDQKWLSKSICDNSGSAKEMYGQVWFALHQNASTRSSLNSLQIFKNILDESKSPKTIIDKYQWLVDQGTVEKLLEYDNLEVKDAVRKALKQRARAGEIDSEISLVYKSLREEKYIVPKEVGANEYFIPTQVGKENGKYYIQHEVFGRIGVEYKIKGSDHSFKLSEQFSRPVPKGAIKANISKQKLPGGYGYSVPLYFYRDKNLNCSDCKKSFIFTAKEQQKWYEEYQIPIQVEMSLCLDCHRKVKGLERLSDIIADLRDDPDNPELLLEEAKYRIFNAKHLKPSSLNRATRCLRVVEKMKPGLTEILYWQAAVEENRGKDKKALEKYRSFIESGSKDAKLKNDALERIAKFEKA